MKKMLMMLIILFAAYFGIQYAFSIFTKGHTVDYVVKNGDREYKIHEVLTYNQKGEENNYYFTIDWNNYQFPVQIYQGLNRKQKVITQIDTFTGDGYTCILPVFDGKIYTDILCEKDKVIYNYRDLAAGNQIPSMDISVFKDYRPDQFVDSPADPFEDLFMTTYRNQLLVGHNIAVDHYKGVYIVNTKLDLKMNLMRFYPEDVYSRPLTAVVKDRYISADYNETYEFNTFILVDLVHSYKSTIKLSKPISFDSYIQGSIDNLLYFIDCANKIQYEINVNKGTIHEIGNVENGAKDYVNGEWVNTNINELIAGKKVFDKSVTSQFPGYDRVDKVGNELSGYYYFYKKNGNTYDVYRSNVQSRDRLTYLFSTTRPDSVSYIKDTVYYLDGDTIKYYNDAMGSRSIIKSKEFTFNPDLYFGVYYRK